ncbi:hypothetical protein [Paractinoplanes aksuensis]|uniref:hypothetical protein n=1 Tax=Paractinoplanes aksuensis TaxID=2939490 RepID=UPI00209BE5AA|nr:hypothetical protein [Actinoplanes aksuensis]
MLFLAPPAVGGRPPELISAGRRHAGEASLNPFAIPSSTGPDQRRRGAVAAARQFGGDGFDGSQRSRPGLRRVS